MGNSKNILGRQDSSYINQKGQEVNSPMPAVEIIESEFNRGDYELERIRAMVRGEMSQHAQKIGYETFEEANDFDVDNDFDDECFEDSKYMTEEFLPPLTGDKAGESSPSPNNGEDLAGEPNNPDEPNGKDENPPGEA